METVIDEAKRLIRSAKLTHTEHPILEAFIQQAVDPIHAAKYVIQRVNEDTENSIESKLRGLLADWRALLMKFTRRVNLPLRAESLVRARDGPNGCMVEGSGEPGKGGNVEPAYIIPPSLFNEIEAESERPLYALLEVFMTAQSLSRLRFLILDGDDESLLQNSWLLSPTIHSAFRTGNVSIVPVPFRLKWDDGDDAESREASQIEYVLVKGWPEEVTNLTFGDGTPFQQAVHSFLLCTPDPERYRLPSRFLLRTHHRIAQSLHLFYVHDCVAKGWPAPSPFRLSLSTQRALRTIWHIFPPRLRVACYHALSKLGKYLYPGEVSILAHRLPFGLYLKKCHRSGENEPNALKLVEQYTSIPAPIVIDTFHEQGSTFLIMTRVPGTTLNHVFHRLSYQERAQFSADLKMFVQQLQAIPNRTNYLFANTLGGPIVDHRIPGEECGPFNTEADFNKALVHKYVGSEVKDAVAPAHQKQHRSVFTHCDLNPSNLVMEGGRISGIIDWESAGYMPEHWEFTKAMFGVWGLEPREEMIRCAFPQKFEEELQAEQMLWKVTPPFL